MTTELSPLERLMEQDRSKSAAQRFTERLNHYRAGGELEAPTVALEGPQEPSSSVVVGRLTPRLVARLAEALGDADDLEADMIRVAFDIPLLDARPDSAGQGGDDTVHFLSDSLSTRTTG